jgi:hypothetical protein
MAASPSWRRAPADITLQTRIQDQPLALAAISQAGELVDRLANTGDVPHEPYQTSIASLFNFEPKSTEAIYGGDPDYRQRLELGFRTLKDIFWVRMIANAPPRSPDVPSAYVGEIASEKKRCSTLLGNV